MQHRGAGCGPNGEVLNAVSAYCRHPHHAHRNVGRGGQKSRIICSIRTSSGFLAYSKTPRSNSSRRVSNRAVRGWKRAKACWQQMTFPATLIDKIRQLPKSENLDLRRLDSRVETWATRRWHSLLQVTGQCCKMAWSLRDSQLGGRKNNLPVYENKMAVISVFSGSRSGMWTGSCMESTVLPEPGQRRKAGYEGRGARIERRGQRRGARRETGDEEGLPQDETWHKEGLA
jgi:hypothetical protein